MSHTVMLEAFLIAAVLTVDTLVVSFSMAVNKVQIPPSRAAVVAFLSSLILALGIMAGSGISVYIPQHLATIICHTALIGVGLYKTLDGCFRREPAAFATLQPFHADKILNVAEACSLGAALSLDSLAAGIGIGAGGNEPFWYTCFSFILGLAFIYAGVSLGKRLTNKTSLNLSWLSGAALMLIGITGMI